MKISLSTPTRVSIIAIALLSTGCASMTGSTDQTISVEARASTDQVAGAMCELDNDKGKWFVSAPGSTRISRSNEDLIVTCKKDGLTPGTMTVESATKGSMAGNLLFGGIIGVIIDHNSGAAYQYPTLIQVLMGQSGEIRVPKQTNQSNTDSPSDWR
jgi:hypothetical protein